MRPVIRSALLRVSCAALVSLAALSQAQTTYHVNGSCGSDSWSGLNEVCQAPDGPKQTIQAGIDASVDGDTVIVADGTYTGSGNRGLDFGGRLITLTSHSGADTCIIDCESRGRGFWFHNGEDSAAIVEGFTVRNGIAEWLAPGGARGGAVLCELSAPTIRECVFVNNVVSHTTGGEARGGAIACAGGDVTIEGCTFRNNSVVSSASGVQNGGGGAHILGSNARFADCQFESNSSEDVGGAIGCEDGSPKFERCGFRSNSSDRGGGAVYCDSAGTPEFVDCDFENNVAEAGGALSLLGGGSPIISGSTFVGNDAQDVSSGLGGAVYLGEVAVFMQDCVLQMNHAARDGGAIYMGQSNGGAISLLSCSFLGNSGDRGGAIQSDWAQFVTITDCVFEDNVGSYGGGIFLGRPGLSLSVSRSAFRRNVATRAGGALAIGRGSAVVFSCVIEHNTAAQDGGGMRLLQGTFVSAGCLIRGNRAATGGGVYVGNNGVARFVNCTLTENIAGAGGGLYSDAGATLDNCIFWGDSPGELGGNLTLATYSTIEGGYFGTGVIGDDPLFADPVNGDYRLLDGSPCIDAADNTAVPPDDVDLDGDGDTDEPLPQDLDGLCRFIDDPATSDTGVPGNGYDEVVDMGAFEFQADTCPADLNGDGVLNTQDFIAFLNAWATSDPLADWNDDGTINTLDFLAYLNDWVAGC